MSFSELYKHCQTLPVPVKRGQIKEKILELTQAPSLSLVRTSLDHEVCRGFFLSARNHEHAIVKQLGGDVVVLARGLNRCWERFIVVKEMMHLFDTATEAADTVEKFDELLNGLLTGSEITSPTRSEINCFWMALACLCPEDERRRLKAEREQKKIDDYSIALRFRIPTQYVPVLFSGQFEESIARLLGSPRDPGAHLSVV